MLELRCRWARSRVGRRSARSGGGWTGCGGGCAPGCRGVGVPVPGGMCRRYAGRGSAYAGSSSLAARLGGAARSSSLRRGRMAPGGRIAWDVAATPLSLLPAATSARTVPAVIRGRSTRCGCRRASRGPRAWALARRDDGQTVRGLSVGPEGIALVGAAGRRGGDSPRFVLVLVLVLVLVFVFVFVFGPWLGLGRPRARPGRVWVDNVYSSGLNAPGSHAAGSDRHAGQEGSGREREEKGAGGGFGYAFGEEVC